jgi:anion-transporting  ArsA/GET3 family ATPase
MMAASPSEPVDGLLASATVLVVIGPGGVGKTTLAAALGARAVVSHQRRVLVVTVDPARRLAEALGIREVAEEPILVPAGPGAGRLWALMVDMARSWDRLVHRHAPDAKTESSLLENPLYRTLTTRFVQSHDYIALDRLADLVDDDRYDLVIIDTPPSTHALGVLDAPDRMIDFFGSRLSTWLTAPYRNRLVRASASPFLAVAERLLGGPFLAQIADFFWLLSALQPDFVRRAKQVNVVLNAPDTRYVMVHTPEPLPAQRAIELAASLAERGFVPSLVLVNRSPDPILAAVTDAEVEQIDDERVREAVAAVLREARREMPDWGDIPIQKVPWSNELATVADLAGVFDAAI